MNLVLPRPLVIFNDPPFDLTEEVAQQFNRVLRSVNMPAEATGTEPRRPPRAAGRRPPGRAAAAARRRRRSGAERTGGGLGGGSTLFRQCRPAAPGRSRRRGRGQLRRATRSGASPASRRCRRPGPDDVSFLDNRKYLPALKATRAGAVVLAAGAWRRRCRRGRIAIVAPAPYLGFARVAALFHPAPRPVPGMPPDRGGRRRRRRSARAARSAPMR